MALSVVMPALEMAQETGKLVSWLKKEGEQVRKGEMLLEVETDKAVVEIEAAGDGHAVRYHREGGRRGPGWPDDRLAAAAGRIDCRPQPDAPTATGRRTDAAPAAAAASRRQSLRRAARRRRVSPKARRLAQDHGVDLATVRGSGPGGEILADDILAAAKGPAEAGHCAGKPSG